MKRIIAVLMCVVCIACVFAGYTEAEVDTAENQLEITCQTDANTFSKHFIGLSEMVSYTVEDLKGANVDPYHYEIHYLPKGNVVNFTFKGVD